MALIIRDMREQELDQVLALNNNAGASILPMDAHKMRHFFEVAGYFRVAEIDGHLAGFLIALGPHVAYDSSNFQWFKSRYADFIYIDRIVIASNYRRHGLGRIFYADVQTYSELRSPYLACEIFLEPRDDASVLFHGTYGFREVGQQSIADGRRVGLLLKELCSYAFVRDTYLRGNGSLPALPWLAERIQHEPPAARVVNAR